MLAAAERQAFEHDGIVQLRQAIPHTEVTAMCDAIWAFLAATQGVDRHDPSTWTDGRPTGFSPLARTGTFDRLWSPTVASTLADIFGPSEQLRERGRVLMTFPSSDTAWVVPASGWHFDYTPWQDAPGVRAVQIFVLLNNLQPKGGGTLVLTGSHHLVSRFVSTTGSDPRPKSVRAALGEAHPWLATLWDPNKAATDTADDRQRRYLNRPVVLDGIETRVVEVTGEVGDVYVMNSDCFHAIAVNSLTTARIMLTSLVSRQP